MDDSLLAHVLSSFLPPDVVSLLDKHLLQPGSPGQHLYQQASALAHRCYTTTTPLVRPVAARLAALAAAHQGYVDAALPLVFFLAVVVVMNWVRRVAMWCARLAVKAVVWACVVAAAAVVWRRGVVESARDAALVGARVVGYVAVLRDVWVDEYKRYEGAQATGRWDEFGKGRGY